MTSTRQPTSAAVPTSVAASAAGTPPVAAAPLAVVPYQSRKDAGLLARAYLLAGLELSRELSSLRRGTASVVAPVDAHSAACLFASATHSISSLAYLKATRSVQSKGIAAPHPRSSSSSSSDSGVSVGAPSPLVKVMHSRVVFDVEAERRQLWLRQVSALALVGCTSVATLGLLSGGFIFARSMWVFTPVTSLMTHRAYLAYEAATEQYSLYALYESSDSLESALTTTA